MYRIVIIFIDYGIVQTIQLVQIVQIVQKGAALFLLNLQGKIPIFEQIQSQVIRFIEAGVLKKGDKLPSVRQLAQENGINPNTVAKAYSELEKSGVVYNIPKKGVYVSEVDPAASRLKQVMSVLQTLKDSGISKEEIFQAADRLYEEGKYA